MEEEPEYFDWISVMENPPGPSHGHGQEPWPRWYCYGSEGFDDAESAIAWALSQSDRVIIGTLTGTYYWAGKQTEQWDHDGHPLHPWPPPENERQGIEASYRETARRLSEVNEFAPRLAMEIAKRLDEATPESWSVTARDDSVVLSYAGDEWQDFLLGDSEVADSYCGVLDYVQSEISEETTDAWPHDPTRGMHMWEPDTELDGNMLHGWYGPKDNPVKRFEPIDLDSLRS